MALNISFEALVCDPDGCYRKRELHFNNTHFESEEQARREFIHDVLREGGYVVQIKDKIGDENEIV